ncbi:hypothetical protein BY458DRAFT_525369, partial [Sporodiniella umbellata]
MLLFYLCLLYNHCRTLSCCTIIDDLLMNFPFVFCCCIDSMTDPSFFFLLYVLCHCMSFMTIS